MRETDPEVEFALASAWEARGRSRVHGATRVGAAVITDAGHVVVGCNVEHRFRSHDIHAEVNALGSFVASGIGGMVVAVVIVAERERFAPCGACMDWIMEIAGSECEVVFQNDPEGPVLRWHASDLMPHYPT